MNSIINIFLSITHIFIIFVLILSLLKFDILNKLLSDKFLKYKKIISSSDILMSIIFIYLIFYVYIYNYASINLLISLILLCIGISVSILLKKLNNHYNLLRYQYLFFTISLYLLLSKIFSYSDAFSITKSGNFDTLNLLVIGIFSILSGLIISIDLSFNFLKKNKINKNFINRCKYNTILGIIITNLVLLLFITEAPFACDIILFTSIILGFSISKFMYNIEIYKIKNILDFSLSILLCLASIFIENVILTMITSIISGLILKELNKDEFKEMLQKLKSAFTAKNI